MVCANIAHSIVRREYAPISSTELSVVLRTITHGFLLAGRASTPILQAILLPGISTVIVYLLAGRG
jgi:hypothetical protein